MIFTRSVHRDAQDALRQAWDKWCLLNLDKLDEKKDQETISRIKNTPSKPDGRPRKRARHSGARKALDMTGNGTITEGMEPVDDGDIPLSQASDGYISCSQELPMSQ